MSWIRWIVSWKKYEWLFVTFEEAKEFMNGLPKEGNVRLDKYKREETMVFYE